MATAREQILEMFHGQGFSPRMTTDEVMNATGLAYSTCRHALIMACAKGLLQRKWNGRQWEYSRYGYSKLEYG